MRAKRAIRKLKEKDDRLTNYKNRVTQDLFVGGKRSFAKAAKRTAAANFKKTIVEAKKARIEANLIIAESSFSGLKQIRRWFWNRRLKKANAKLQRAQTVLQSRQQNQATVKQAHEREYQAIVAKKQAKTAKPKAVVDMYLSRVAQQLKKFEPVLKANLDWIERVNPPDSTATPTTPPTPAPKVLDNTQINDLRAKIQAEINAADKKTAAYCLLEADVQLRIIKQSILGKNANPARAKAALSAAIAVFSQNAP
ncbi:MAG: hypothetical protein V1777_00330 [Candidatus Micrarchaeota archaeon]